MGMTKLEKFTMAAMNGLMQNTNYAGMPGFLIARRAFEVANETLKHVQLNEELQEERESEQFSGKETDRD